MKKLIAIFILFSMFFTGKEVFAITGKEAFCLDLTLPSGISEKELANGLKGELKELAGDFVAAEEKYGVNAVFLAAVAALESGWGKSCFRANNIFGWSGKSFGSKEECVDFVASKIAEHYLSENGKYFHGKTVSGVNVCYNGSVFWERKIAGIMAMISERSKEKTVFSLAEKDPSFTVVFIG